MVLFLFLILAYLLGSIPFALIIGFKVKGIDLREHGSKNIGATNAFRVIGKKWGIIALILDALKGYIACILPSIFQLEYPFYFMVLLALLAILGHTFPVWLRFKGGKGVATSLGVFMALTWKATLSAFILFWVVFAISRIISISSLSAAAFFPVSVIIFHWGTPENSLLLTVSSVLCIFIFYTHRANIKRLLRGEEKKLL